MHVLLPLPMQKTTQNTGVPNSSGQRGPCTPAVADLGNDLYELYSRALDSEMRVTTTAFCRRAQEVGFEFPFLADMDCTGLSQKLLSWAEMAFEMEARVGVLGPSPQTGISLSD